jgi:hypothetical protein
MMWSFTLPVWDCLHSRPTDALVPDKINQIIFSDQHIHLRNLLLGHCAETNRRLLRTAPRLTSSIRHPERKNSMLRKTKALENYAIKNEQP